MAKIQSINPATEEVVAEFEEATPKDIQQAISRARNAQRDWAGKPREHRLDCMGRLKGVLESRKQEILKTVESETAYPPAETEPEFLDILDAIGHYSERYRRMENMVFPLDSNVRPDTSAQIQYVPHGVIGHIGIWNYPFWQTMITAIPALLAGNAIVYKPSEYVTLTGKKIGECIHAAGIPEDVYQVVIGGESVGRQLVRSDDLDAIVFTGGIDTGKEIIKQAGVKPLILELSGNDAAIVAEDCDLEQTVRGISFGTFLHAGQVCIRIKRVYVPEGIAEEFVSGLVDYARKLTYGKEILPLIRKEAREEVHRKVEDAAANGSKLLLGGKIPEGKGFYYPPTILRVTNPDTEVMRDETFGPVCSIFVVKDVEEAIRRANDSPYGLGSTVWSQNYKRAAEIAQRLQAGTVWINDSNLPLTGGDYFHGWKQSGGNTSQDRLMRFMKARTVINYQSKKPRDWWF